MKNLIIIALDESILKLDNVTPNTRKGSKTIDISDVNPIDIPAFMKENNIPDTAEFDGVENGYDGWNVGEICLSWEIDVPTTDKEKLEFRRRRFTSIAAKSVYDLLIENGFNRVGFNSALLRNFNDTTPYDMYINNEFDRLVDYYSMSFKK